MQKLDQVTDSQCHSHVRDRRSLSQQRVNLFLVSVSCSLVELAANRFPSVHSGLCKLRGRHLNAPTGVNQSDDSSVSFSQIWTRALHDHCIIAAVGPITSNQTTRREKQQQHAHAASPCGLHHDLACSDRSHASCGDGGDGASGVVQGNVGGGGEKRLFRQQRHANHANQWWWWRRQQWWWWLESCLCTRQGVVSLRDAGCC
jgi:hypothetical protein